MADPPSARSSSTAAPLGLVNRFLSHGPDRAEALCAAWEIFSVLLFASAVVPVALSSPWPGAVFLLSLVVSWVALPSVARFGETGIVLASAVRVLSWPLALLLLPERTDFRLWIATLTFGIMAGAMRRAIYRRELLPVPTGSRQASGATSGPAVAAWMRTRLGESAAMAGILGGHLLILFGVAFLRVGSDMLFRGPRTASNSSTLFVTNRAQETTRGHESSSMVGVARTYGMWRKRERGKQVRGSIADRFGRRILHPSNHPSNSWPNHRYAFGAIPRPWATGPRRAVHHGGTLHSRFPGAPGV